jgi:hypothetical protein
MAENVPNQFRWCAVRDNGDDGDGGSDCNGGGSEEGDGADEEDKRYSDETISGSDSLFARCPIFRNIGFQCADKRYEFFF